MRAVRPKPSAERPVIVLIENKTVITALHAALEYKSLDYIRRSAFAPRLAEDVLLHVGLKLRVLKIGKPSTCRSLHPLAWQDQVPQSGPKPANDNHLVWYVP